MYVVFPDKRILVWVVVEFVGFEGVTGAPDDAGTNEKLAVAPP